MTSKLGCHWLREHPDQFDMPHVEAMQYKSVKLFKPAWDNADFCRDLLTVLPKDAYILARDHELSEQKEGMWSKPEEHGKYHADEWMNKVRGGTYHMPLDRTFFLGINEPDATNGDRNAIDIYTAAFLDRLRTQGLRGGAFNFSTGHPRTVDGTPNTQADYTVFERSHRAIVNGQHIGVLHIYGTGAVPCAPGHYDRLLACTWQDVEWVVGEFGVDEHVIGGGAHDGFHKYFNGRLDDYCGWLDTAIIGINDARIHSYQVFTYDFSHPWDSFDTSPIRGALEGHQWRHMQQQPSSTGPQPVPPPQPPVKPAPIAAGIIEPRVAQAILKVESGGRTHGENGKPLIRFEAHIFVGKAGNTGHFRYHQQKPWTEQQWRKSAGDPWRNVHTGQQADEYAAFEFARSINADDAYQSISMGAGQIMGFNHLRIGYQSAEAMYKAFQDSQVQTIGFINFFLSDPALADAMRRKDWREIAKRYNGAGAVDTYAPLLEKAYKELGGI